MDTVIVAAAVIVENGKFLIARRKKESHLGNYWEFPGGKREDHEDMKSCLMREVHEELGIQISVGERILETSHAYPDRKINIHFFHCEWKGGDLGAVGCDEYLWVEKNALGRFAFPPANSELIKKLQNS